MFRYTDEDDEVVEVRNRFKSDLRARLYGIATYVLVSLLSQDHDNELYSHFLLCATQI